ncbi:MAG: hypothetical protein WDN25_04770 [Acetobacteraceae bacterium]
MGASGSGKSSFLRCLNRLEEPSSGYHPSRRRRGSRQHRPTWRRSAGAWEWYSSTSTCFPT